MSLYGRRQEALYFMDPGRCPKAEMSWEATESQIVKTLSERLREITQQWKEDNKVFAYARKSFLKHFQQRYNFVEEQLRYLHHVVIADTVGRPAANYTDSGLTLAGGKPEKASPGRVD